MAAIKEYYSDGSVRSSGLTRTATRRERRKKERAELKRLPEKYDWVDYAPTPIKRMVENTFRCNLQSKGECGCIDECKYGRPIIPVAVSSDIKSGGDIKLEYVDLVSEPVKYIEDRDHLPF